MRGLKIGALLLAVVMLVGLWAVPSALADEKPRYGGTLRVAIAGDPPSLDMHQEQTFLVTIPFSTVYNSLVVFDPHGYPKIIGDLAKSWTISDDKMAWTFTLHQGVTFHDGSALTSADVKASWDKIISPPRAWSARARVFIRWSRASRPPTRTRSSSDCTMPRRHFCRCWPIRRTSSMPKNISIRTRTTTNSMPWAAGHSN